MGKIQKKHMGDDVVVISTCDGNESNMEGSGRDRNSDLDGEDDLVIDDLDTAHHNKGASTFEFESSGNRESEGETEEDLLADYEREQQRKQHSGMV